MAATFFKGEFFEPK